LSICEFPVCALAASAFGYREPAAASVLRQLISQAKAAGAPDNVTVVLLRYGKQE
jgi:serine/threonine protein phosphatase PrpC